MKTINPKNYKYFIIIIAIVISTFIIISGKYYYEHDKQITRLEKYNELKAIADLKTNEIVQWHNERLSEASFFSKHEMMVEETYRLVNGNNQSAKILQKSLIHLVDGKRYDNIFILNTNGSIIFSLDSSFSMVDSTTINLNQKIQNTRNILFSDFYICSYHKSIHFDIIAPFIDKKNNVFATLIFRVNPNDYLYPIIQNWPTPSKSAETLIVRSDGDSVLFLNELRHIKETALRLKMPTSLVNLPANKAILGRTGIFEGIDYRNINVISDLRSIPGTNWYMVAKIDKDEIFKELYKEAIFITVLTLLIILFLVTFLTWIYNSRQKNMYKKLLANEIELHESHEEFRATLYSIGDGVITTNKVGLIKQMNGVAEHLTGWNEKDAKGKKLEVVFHIINEDTREKVETPVKKVLKEGMIVGLANHTVLISKDGKEIPIADSGAPIKDITGNITGVVLVFRDQTESRFQQKILKESEERFQLLFNKAPLGYQSLDFDGNFIDVNQQWLDSLGYNRNEVIGKWFGDFLAPEFRDAFRERFPIFKTQGYIHSEFEMLHKTGNRLFISFEGKIGYNKFGEFIQTHCILQDITEKKKAEEQLIESEAKHKNLFNSIRDSILVTDINRKIVQINPAFEELFGFTAEEIIGKETSYLYKNRGEFEQMGLKIKENTDNHNLLLTNIYKKKNGEIFPGETNVFYLKNSKGELLGFIGTIRDITERRKTEIALQESEAYIKLILDNLPIGVAVNSVDPTVKFDYMNENFPIFYRTKKENLVDNNIFWETVYEDSEYREIIKKKVLADCASGNPDQMFWEDIPITRKGQQVTYISAKNIPIEGKGLMISVVWDVTERKKAEIELTKRENLLQKIFDILPIGLWFTDKNGKILKGNPAGIKIWGAEPKVGIEEYKVFKARRLPSGEEIANNDWALYHTITKGVTITDELLEIEAFDGTKKIILNYTAPIFDNDGNIDGAIVVNNDITNLKLTEAQLKERELLFQALMDNSPIYIFFKDRDIRAMHLSKNYEQMLGKPLSELLGKDMFDLFPSELAKKMIEDDKKIVDEGKMVVVDEELNEHYYTTIKFPILQENNEPILAGFTIDITDRKKVEQELVKLNEELEQRIKERTQDLENKNSELERMNKAFIGRELRIKELKEKIIQIENSNREN